MKTQKETLEWAVSVWGEGVRNRKERARRMLEEAIELAQVEGVSQDEILRLSNRVFSRPPGELSQEIAGVATTLSALAENAGVQLEKAVEDEWERLEKLTPEYFAKKHADKVSEGNAI